MAGKWGRRPRYVYAYDVLDIRHEHTEVRVGYVGKTSSRLCYRDAQHRASKPWAWAIVGEIRPVWSGDCGRIALWFREVYYIHRMKPLFNYEHNTANPDRVPIWQAKRLYDRRDATYRRNRIVS